MGSVSALRLHLCIKMCLCAFCVILLRFSGISQSPHHPAAPQLAAPPFPAATGAPPGPSAWQSRRFGRSPTSPPWQLLPSAVLSQTVLGSDKVTPPVTVSGAVGGGWGGGEETYLLCKISPLNAEFKVMSTNLGVKAEEETWLSGNTPCVSGGWFIWVGQHHKVQTYKHKLSLAV